MTEVVTPEVGRTHCPGRERASPRARPTEGIDQKWGDLPMYFEAFSRMIDIGSIRINYHRDEMENDTPWISHSRTPKWFGEDTPPGPSRSEGPASPARRITTGRVAHGPHRATARPRKAGADRRYRSEPSACPVPVGTGCRGLGCHLRAAFAALFTGARTSPDARAAAVGGWCDASLAPSPSPHHDCPS
jgi:hypothetical protein